MESARRRLQALSAETSEMTAIAHAAHTLGQIARYGDVRRFDPEPLMPLVEELFVQGARAVRSAARQNPLENGLRATRTLSGR